MWNSSETIMVTLPLPLGSRIEVGKTFYVLPWSGDRGKRAPCSRSEVTGGRSEVGDGVEVRVALGVETIVA